jgi:hypothetical protein
MKVEYSSVLEHATDAERQLPILDRDFHVQPIWQHGKPWSKIFMLNVDASE